MDESRVDPWPEHSTPVRLDGPAGVIEAVLAGGRVPAPAPARLAIVCHPHSLHGGSMDNKVVTMVERSLRVAGCATVRFNFRGVGNSAGVFDDGQGEGEDLAAVLQYARRRLRDAELWLAGFSFGSYVSARMAGALGARLLISVAPPVERFGFRELPRPPCRWIVLQGDADEVVDPAEVADYFAEVQPPVEYLNFPGAGHFFHGRLVEMRQRLDELLPAA